MAICECKEQTNKTDDSKIIASLQIAKSFAKMRLRKELIIAALLSNIVDESEKSNLEIKNDFGNKILAHAQEILQLLLWFGKEEL